MTEILHHGATWVWIVLAFALGYWIRHIFAFLAELGWNIAAFGIYWGKRAMILVGVVTVVVFAVRSAGGA